jgi:hypothetical protein
MRKKIIWFCALAALFMLSNSGCTGSSYWSPTYPDYGHDVYGGNGNGDNDPILSRHMEGEWEGFMYEQSRSDNLGLGKKMVAMKCSYAGLDGYCEHVKVELLIDGHPTALTEVDVCQEDYLDFYSHKDDIDLSMNAWFSDYSASGSMDLAWEEKVKLPGSDKADMHYVEMTGDFDLSPVRGSQWASAWKLFDQYGEGAFDLSGQTWALATETGLAHLAKLEEVRLKPSE